MLSDREILNEHGKPVPDPQTSYDLSFLEIKCSLLFNYGFQNGNGWAFVEFLKECKDENPCLCKTKGCSANIYNQ